MNKWRKIFEEPPKLFLRSESKRSSKYCGENLESLSKDILLRVGSPYAILSKKNIIEHAKLLEDSTVVIKSLCNLLSHPDTG